MKRNLAILLVGTMIVSAMLAGCGQNGSTDSEQTTAKTGELKGDITFWHSFTQGPRLEVIQETADHRPGFRKCAGYEYSAARTCCGDDGCRGFGSPG